MLNKQRLGKLFSRETGAGGEQKRKDAISLLAWKRDVTRISKMFLFFVSRENLVHFTQRFNLAVWGRGEVIYLSHLRDSSVVGTIFQKRLYKSYQWRRLEKQQPGLL